MKAVVTSIGEITRDMCIWSLERNGFDVVVYDDPSTLADKLKRIYHDLDENFIRVDADVVVNRNITPKMMEQLTYHAWWIQFQSFSWFTMDRIWGGVQYIKQPALKALRENIDAHMRDIRPETSMTRLPEFYDPRRFESHAVIAGIHGFAAQDMDRIKDLKRARNQYDTYDWELAEKMMELLK
jgi:hypothetical protein